MKKFKLFIIFLFSTLLILVLGCGKGKKESQLPYSDSIRAVTKKIEKDPTNWKNYRDRAEYYHKNALEATDYSEYKEYIDSAYSDCSKIIELEPYDYMGYYYRSMYGYPTKSSYLLNRYKKEFPNLSSEELAKKIRDNLSESDKEEDIIMSEKSIENLKTGIKNCKDETARDILKSSLEWEEFTLGLQKSAKRMREFIEEESNLK